jgi:hypothetical protein
MMGEIWGSLLSLYMYNILAPPEAEAEINAIYMLTHPKMIFSVLLE